METQNSKNTLRFFIGEACYNTWPKIFVLSSDGVLYSKYLSYMQIHTYVKNVDIEKFNPNQFKWGQYQRIHEVTESEALSKELTKQKNWVSDYLSLRKSIDVKLKNLDYSTDILDSLSKIILLMKLDYFNSSPTKKNYLTGIVANDEINIELLYECDKFLSGKSNMKKLKTETEHLLELLD